MHAVCKQCKNLAISRPRIIVKLNGIEDCRTLLHMHTRMCMCGALYDPLAAAGGMGANPPSPHPKFSIKTEVLGGGGYSGRGRE